MRKLTDIAWLGGLLEGEGCFYSSGSTPCIKLGMTDQDTVEKAAALLGVKMRGPCTVKGKDAKKHYKPHFDAGAYGVLAVQWMMTLYSFLGVRRQAKIREILGVWKNRIPSRAPNGQRSMAICHPERFRIGRKLCKNCYMQMWRSEHKAKRLMISCT